jgi:chloride channel 3/4/5
LELTELVAALFSECTPENRLNDLCLDADFHGFMQLTTLLAYALVLKMVLSAVSTTLKIPAGMFMSSMAVGACFGRIVGMSVEYLYRMNPTSPIFAECPTDGSSCAMPGVYAMIGAAAALAGVSRMTVSLAVIMFELTGALSYILPIMISIMISKWIADGFSKKSIYDHMISLKGLPYLNAKLEYLQVGHTGDVMEKGLEVIDIDEENTVAQLTNKLDVLASRGYADGGLPILESDRLIGYIACTELQHALSKVRVKGDHIRCYFKKSTATTDSTTVERLNDFTAYTDRAPLTVNQNASMDVVLELFMKLGLRYLCVVRNGKYVGLIHKKRLLAYLNELEE